MNIDEINCLPKPYCDLYFEESISKWDEGLPLGNGLLGCLVWGDGHPLKFSLDRADLWDNRSAKETLSKDFNYKKLIELVREQNQDKIRKNFDNCYSNPTPTKIPAGRLELNFAEKPEQIKSSLKLDKAMAQVDLYFSNGCINVKTYLHSEKKIGWIRIEGNIVIPEITIVMPAFGVIGEERQDEGSVERNISVGSLDKLCYPHKEWFEENNLKWFVQKTAEDFEYGVFTLENEFKSGKDILFYIGCGNEEEDWVKQSKKIIKEAMSKGYENMMATHCEWWKNFWEKSSISLPDKMFEKQWYLTNYLFGSCSRKGAPPMPLQGVWTADEGNLPPWKGDYHNDLNTQMSYCHYFKANHLEEGESFIDFLWNLVPEAREFANTFFDSKGLCLPSVMTIKGKPLGGWPMYSLTLTNQIWLCQNFELYWRYTGDDKFLEQKAYPYFKKTAICITRWLEKDENGKLKLPLSSSPEIHDDELEAWLTPNSNYDQALLIYLFKTLGEMAKTLGYDEYSKWDKVLNKLDEMAVNEHKVLMLNENEELKESHRHHSHAMGIYPLRLLSYDNNKKDKEIIDATVSNLELLGSGLWVGFSFPWMAQFYGVQGNGEGAAYQLKLFWENFCSPNGFHINGDYKKRGVSSLHYRPFTLEANMCAADALQEMLLKTDQGVIKVFPAIPEEWKKGDVSFKNFRGWNGIKVSAKMKSGKLISISLETSKSAEYIIENCFDKRVLTIGKSGQKTIIDCEIGENLKIGINRDEKCIIYEA